MAMPMVQVGPVRVGVGEGVVPVGVGVRCIGWRFTWMCMLMMCVMAVPVAMFQRLVRMGMQVIFGQAQPDANAHQ